MKESGRGIFSNVTLGAHALFPRAGTGCWLQPKQSLFTWASRQRIQRLRIYASGLFMKALGTVPPPPPDKKTSSRLIPTEWTDH
jgi:hypothetical protein